MVVAVLSITPVFAAIYRHPSNFIQAYNPESACRLKAFWVEYQRYGQVFRGLVHPDLTLIPCSRYNPEAHFGGSFRSFKRTGDRSEGCRGDVSLRFDNYGRMLELIFVHRGSLPGNYCRDRNKVLEFRLRRS